MKIVVNRCFGGFGLSDKAYERMIELGVPVKAWVPQKRDEITGLYEHREDERAIYDRDLSEDDRTSTMRTLVGRYWETFIDRENRTDPLLVQVVEELGNESWGKFAKLKVVEIPDGIEYEIDEYDGQESVHEKHRSW